MKPLSSYISIIMIIILLFGCSSSSQVDIPKEKLSIYTSIYPIQFLVERIGGDTVVTKTIFPPGVEAHSYEPTAKDMVSIAKSDAFIYMGGGMEGFSETIASALESEQVELIPLSANEELFEHSHTTEIHGAREEEHNHHDHNPHIWLDPIRMIRMGQSVKDVLIELNPDKRTIYEKNFNNLSIELKLLDKKFKETLQNKTNREILVSHAAYNYWEDRYGIIQIPINGITSSEEPSQKDLVTIIKEADKSNLHYVLFEQNTINSVSAIIQKEIRAKAFVLHNLEVLTENDIEHGEDYFSLMYRNLNVLDKVTK
ncbi:metal ABC transporter solute-binding protein, Zn/Mn family [Ornithinibacillus bavariensis]|uniref:Adhesin n=1 Tax=Ornithinibacillus bavariensis TaxID=545502 RepID=A0A920C8X4_9BACI|nr:zinc ABC transporter substrate-binding protein [Ornithinibacillus bavariensis]GIO28674.1 adhesin [Ornithinibacillus bavariensis]